MDWLENLARDEMPPRWMWPFAEELESWFADVEEQRKDKYSSDGSGDDSADSSMMENELARGRR